MKMTELCFGFFTLSFSLGPPESTRAYFAFSYLLGFFNKFGAKVTKIHTSIIYHIITVFSYFAAIYLYCMVVYVFF